MNLVYFGSGHFGLDCLNAIIKTKHNLRFIVTQPAQLAGRGRKPTPTPVAAWAIENSIEYIETQNVNSQESVSKILQYKPDLIVVIAFGQKVSNQVISIAPKAAINVHASLLPKYRGAAPINWAIIKGETKTGISIITLADKMDAGDILAYAETDIGQNETAEQLHDRLASLAAPVLCETIDKIADGSAIYTKQDHSKATLAPKLKKSDGHLDFSESAQSLKNKILGLWPWPGASALYATRKTAQKQRVTFATAEVANASKSLPHGTLDENLNIVCGQDALKILKLQPAGSSLMDFQDFVNGRQTMPGDSFKKIDT